MAINLHLSVTVRRSCSPARPRTRPGIYLLSLSLSICLSFSLLLDFRWQWSDASKAAKSQLTQQICTLIISRSQRVSANISHSLFLDEGRVVVITLHLLTSLSLTLSRSICISHSLSLSLSLCLSLSEKWKVIKKPKKSEKRRTVANSRRNMSARYFPPR